jgi:hypothetical protein
MANESKPLLDQRDAGNPGKDFWSPGCRLAVFALASTSILSLLAEFYGVCSMRAFTLAISLPALVGLLAWALRDRAVGSQRLWWGIVVGSVAGLVAAFGYDLFRLLANACHCEEGCLGRHECAESP